jgi:hypothetical protein
MITFKGCQRKATMAYLRYFSSIHLVGTKKYHVGDSHRLRIGLRIS